MRIVLTGITGFIGQALMPMLNNKINNIEILTINNNVEKANFYYPNSKYKNCRHIHYTELDELSSFNPEIVIHLATLTTHRNDTEIIKPMLLANIEFGVLLLNALSKCKGMKLFVNTGSFAEYSTNYNSFNSANLYAATKTAFRSFVNYYSDICNYKYITVIPYSVYGGNMTVKRIMDYITESMDSVLPVNMTKGEQVLDFIYIDDICNFFLYVIENTETLIDFKKNGEEFHLGTGIGTSIRELANMFEEKYQKRCNINWGAIPYQEKDIMYSVAPIEKNKNLINWKAKYQLFDKI